MALSTRNQDIYQALLLLIAGELKSSPRQRLFRKITKDPIKLSGIGKITVPVVVWDVLKDADALTTEWDVTIEDGEGGSPAFVMHKR